MIDIVFLLIIFFMVSTRFGKLQNERDMKIQVPTVSSAAALTSAPRKRIINVYQDGQITIDDKGVTLPELENELTAAKQQYPKLGVVIRGDGTASHQRMTEVYTACGKARVAVTVAIRETQLR